MDSFFLERMQGSTAVPAFPSQGHHHPCSSQPGGGPSSPRSLQDSSTHPPGLHYHLFGHQSYYPAIAGCVASQRLLRGRLWCIPHDRFISLHPCHLWMMITSGIIVYADGMQVIKHTNNVKNAITQLCNMPTGMICPCELFRVWKNHKTFKQYMCWIQAKNQSSLPAWFTHVRSHCKAFDRTFGIAMQKLWLDFDTAEDCDTSSFNMDMATPYKCICPKLANE